MSPSSGKALGKTNPLFGHNHPLMFPCPTCDAIGKELLARIAELEAELAEKGKVERILGPLTEHEALELQKERLALQEALRVELKARKKAGAEFRVAKEESRVTGQFLDGMTERAMKAEAEVERLKAHVEYDHNLLDDHSIPHGKFKGGGRESESLLAKKATPRTEERDEG